MGQGASREVTSILFPERVTTLSGLTCLLPTAKQMQRSIARLTAYHGRFRLDLPFGGDLVNVPPATQRFDQLHAARHLLYTEHDYRLLICEQDCLCRKDVQIRIKPGLVSHRRDIDKALRRRDGLLLLLNLPGKQAQGGEVVLGLLECRQYHLLIIRDVSIVERRELSHRRFS
jgi:hypothetical protein